MAEALKVWTDGNHKVIAESAEEAVFLLVKEFGPAEGDEGHPKNWRSMNDTDRIGISYVEGPEECHVSHTAFEWVAQNGRGYLCSQEW